CGTGASALPAAEAIGPNGVVIGVDLSARLLDRARIKAARRGLNNVEFRLSDMTSLGCPAGEFDCSDSGRPRTQIISIRLTGMPINSGSSAKILRYGPGPFMADVPSAHALPEPAPEAWR